MKWKRGSPTYRKMENESTIGQNDGKKSHILVREEREGRDEKQKRLEA